MPTAKSWPDGRLVMRKMPPPPTSHSHAYSRVSAKESHNKPMRGLAGSVPEMPEPCRNKDCVFQRGGNREEPYIVDTLNASGREESVVSPFQFGDCDWFTGNPEATPPHWSR